MDSELDISAKEIATTIRCANRDGHFAAPRLFDFLDAAIQRLTAERDAAVAMVREVGCDGFGEVLQHVGCTRCDRIAAILKTSAGEVKP